MNVYREQGNVALAIRYVVPQVPTIPELGLPPIVTRLADEHDGLVLVTGSTGSGKSTTLASMISHINRTRDAHVVTIEDPVEYRHIERRCHHQSAGDRPGHRELPHRAQDGAAPGPRRDPDRRDA